MSAAPQYARARGWLTWAHLIDCAHKPFPLRWADLPRMQKFAAPWRCSQPMNTDVPFPIRTECPPGTCVCERDALLATPQGDVRILRLTRTEEKKLLERLENLTSLSDLRHMQARIEQQLGVRLTITPNPNEVRSLRGIAILVLEQPGLCRKTRQAIPAAIRKSMDQRPEITFDLLNEGGLFGAL